MVYLARTVARNAERDPYNAPGMCLQVCRIWAGINARYLTATKAWYAIPRSQRNYGRYPPRGAAVYWTGGSHGYGHIAISLGGGKVRSTDAGGRGRVATVSIPWIRSHWGLPYAGWSWYINGTKIPHPYTSPNRN